MMVVQVTEEHVELYMVLTGVSQKYGTVNTRGHIVSFGNEGYVQGQRGCVAVIVTL